MKELIRIGDVCKTYGVTSRTLRYYEEVGLLQSDRHENGYRSYDRQAITRLEQILFLRELKLSIGEITELLDTKDADRVVTILGAKLDAINDDIHTLRNLKRALQICLDILKDKGMSVMPVRHLETRIKKMANLKEKSSDMEVYQMCKNTIEKLSKHEVRIVKLPPMMVASYRAESSEPEGDAWDKLIQWKQENHINEGIQKRQFGFDNPSQKEGSPIYGYEVWEEVDKDVKGSDGVTIKQFPGGIYAVTTATAEDPYMDIPRRWTQLHQWVMDSNYIPADHQCFEEHLPSVFEDDRGFQLDLYYPIKHK